jgi:hypothetical protein
MDHEKRTLISINDNEGDIVDDVIVCYLTARKLRAYLLCDLILFQACEIGRNPDVQIVLRRDQITKAYTETLRPDDALRNFLAALVAYQRRNDLDNPISGKDKRADKTEIEIRSSATGFPIRSHGRVVQELCRSKSLLSTDKAFEGSGISYGEERREESGCRKGSS